MVAWAAGPKRRRLGGRRWRPAGRAHPGERHRDVVLAPLGVGPVDEGPGQREGLGPTRRGRRHQGGEVVRPPSSSSTARRNRPGPTRGRRGRGTPCEGCGPGRRSQPPGDGVGLRPALGVGPGHPVRDLLRGERVVGGQQPGVPGVGQPVGPAVADPARDEQRPVQTAATNVHDAGLPGPGARVGMTASLAASAAATRAWALAATRVPRRVPDPRGWSAARTSRAARAAAGWPRPSRSRRDPVTAPRAPRGCPARPRRPGRRRPRCGCAGHRDRRRLPPTRPAAR